jgi:predicted outer membrane repeat protein
MESFIRKPSSISGHYRKPMAFVGVTTLALGLGAVQSVTATASNTQADCDNTNTVQSGDSRDDVQTLINDDAPLICLQGSFDFTGDFLDTQDRDLHFYGLGEATITNAGNSVFFSDSGSGSLVIENLTLQDSGGYPFGAVVSSGPVTIIDSIFANNESGIYGGAIWGYGTVTISNSTFTGNTAEQTGGAIWGSEVIVTNSTFSGNTITGETSFGGAIYSDRVDIENSTFFNNSASGEGSEGGAINAMSGRVIFSTFVNNHAPEPSGGDIPGNSIYKFGDLELDLGGNIFAGTEFPELGKGGPEVFTNFGDLGGNVFSTSALTEEDLNASESSVFSKSLAEIFGTTTPTLATFVPDTFGTQTLGLATDSPARSAVTSGAVFDLVSTDQRGASRTQPYSAGAFELDPPAVVPETTTVVPATTSSPALAKTGPDNSLGLSFFPASLIALGASALAFRSSLKRRKA